METQGKKFDAGKSRWRLLPLAVIDEVVRVLMLGEAKYGADNWHMVAAADHMRYFDALMRHLAAWQSGERVDKESGRSHLAHAMCCLVFLLWYELTPKKK